MRRRDFLGGLGSAAAWPVIAHSQQPTIPTVVAVAVTLEPGCYPDRMGAGVAPRALGPQVALAPPRHLAISRRIPIFVKVASRERWTGGCHDLARVLARGRDGLNASRPPEELRYSSCGWRGDFRRKRIPGMSD